MRSLRDILLSFAPAKRYGRFIDNRWGESESGKTIHNCNQTIGAFLTRVPYVTAADVDLAVQAANREFPTGATPLRSSAPMHYGR